MASEINDILAESGELKIAYYKLKKDLPSAKRGSIVSVCYDSGMPFLRVDAIVMPFSLVKECPNWLTPVTVEQHQRTCIKNAKIACKEKGVKYSEFLKHFK